MGLAAAQVVAPDVLVRWFGLTLEPISHCDRTGLYGTCVRFDDTALPRRQQYLVARCVAAYALQQLGLLHEMSPHGLAVELCGVSSDDGTRLADVVPFPRNDARGSASPRVRKHTGWSARSR